MKMELRAARFVMQWQAIPNLRRGRISFALRAPLFLLGARLRMMRLLAGIARLRIFNDSVLLRLP
jgi:hypothetical protein